MRRRGGGKTGIALGGTAIVCCVHDRQKREFTDPPKFRLLFRFSHRRDPHRVSKCGCCENLFEPLDANPSLCRVCSGPTVHTLAAPVADPIEGEF